MSTPDESLMQALLQRSERKFAQQLASLERIAALNAAAFNACTADLDQSDPEMAYLTAEATARAISQLALLAPCITLLALDYETAAAAAEALHAQG